MRKLSREKLSRVLSSVAGKMLAGPSTFGTTDGCIIQCIENDDKVEVSFLTQWYDLKYNSSIRPTNPEKFLHGLELAGFA